MIHFSVSSLFDLLFWWGWPLLSSSQVENGKSQDYLKVIVLSIALQVQASVNLIPG